MTDRERTATAVRRLRDEDKRRRSRPLDGNEMRELLALARARVKSATDLRATLRRKSDPANRDRQAQIAEQRNALRVLAQQLRVEACRLPHDPERDQRWGAEVRSVSRAVQAERRKLTKMANRGRA